MDKKEKEEFTKAIYDIVCRIPKGRATSYGAIAKAIGHPNMSRLVGKIMSNSDSLKKNIPAHRVVNSQGILSATELFPQMQQFLENEGVVVINGRIKNWKIIFWDPIIHISI